MGDVEAKRAAAVAAKEEKRKKEVEEIKARKKEMQAKRDAEKDEKSKEADAAEKKKAEVEAKRAENVKAKEAGRGGNKKGGSKYSKKDVMELKKVFDEYDKDGSGKVTLEEFTASLKSKKASSAPRPGQKSSLEERNAAKGISIADLGENVFAEMDRDGDGDVRSQGTERSRRPSPPSSFAILPPCPPLPTPPLTRLPPYCMPCR